MMSRMTDRNPSAAPGGLELVRRFVNTLDIEQGTDALDADWLTANGLGRAGSRAELTERAERAERAELADLAELVEVREALRAAMLANHDDAQIPADDLAVLDAAARRAGLRIRFLPTGEWAPICERAGAVGVLLTEVVTAMAGGRWSRLKVCLNDECRWAFYDHSNSRASKWCDMRICGNRVKQRAHRARARGN